MSTMTFQRTAPLSRRPSSPALAGRLRLTRRGRLVVVLVLAALTLVAFSLGRVSSSDASRPAAVPAAARPTTVVQPGETLWSIARRIDPGADPRVMVARLTSLNDLAGRPLQAGQRLTLPYTG